MEALKKYTYLIIIAGLCLVIFWLSFCRGQQIITKTGKDSVRVETYTVPGDATIDTLYYPTPVPYAKDSIIHDTIKLSAQELYKDYYSTFYYSLPLLDDTGAFVRVVETVKCNRIQSTKLFFQNRRPTQITTVVNPPAEKLRNMVYVGAFINSDLKGIGAGPSVLLVTKNRRFGYTAGYDLVQKNIQAGFYYKLQFK